MPNATAATTRTKITIRDEESSRIRWSSTKRGFIVWSEFFNGPRGGRFRPVRSTVLTTLDAAIALAEREPTRYRQAVRSVTIFEVDHLGRVVEALEA